MIVWHYYEPVGWEECKSAAPYAPHDELLHVVTFGKRPNIKPGRMALPSSRKIRKRTLRFMEVLQR